MTFLCELTMNRQALISYTSKADSGRIYLQAHNPFFFNHAKIHSGTFSQYHRRSAGEMVPAILVRHFDAVQPHDPDRVRGERLCTCFFHSFHDFPDHDRRDDPKRSVRFPVGLGRDPLVLLEPVGEIHLLDKRFELFRDAVAVIPSEGTRGGEVDGGHGDLATDMKIIVEEFL